MRRNGNIKDVKESKIKKEVFKIVLNITGVWTSIKTLIAER